VPDKKSSSTRKWNGLDNLVYLAGGRPHEKAREYVQKKAWEKAYGKSSSYKTSSYWSTDSTHGSSSSKKKKYEPTVHFSADTKKS
jgi:hypothetical protein